MHAAWKQICHPIFARVKELTTFSLVLAQAIQTRKHKVLAFGRWKHLHADVTTTLEALRGLRQRARYLRASDFNIGMMMLTFR